MTTKICKQCSIEKPIQEFPFTNKTSGKLRTRCKICFSERKKKQYTENLENRRRHNRESYSRNREKRKKEVLDYQKRNKDKVKKWQDKRRAKIQKQWIEWKSTLFCTKCGETHVSCLEFHHIDPSVKEGLITKMRFSKQRLKRELEKCVVLCSNCHRKLHWEEKQL